MSAHEKTQQLFSDISRFVAESRSMLAAGAVMELSGLDAQVARLCKEVLQLSQDERVRYADDLQRLLSELNGLGEALMRQRDFVSSEILNLPNRLKASTAYRTIDAVDGGGKKDSD